ncbi:hypothetical protein ACWGSA_08335, partial [Streptomyces diastaticus]
PSRSTAAAIRMWATAVVDVALAAVDVAATVFVMNDERVGWVRTQEPLPMLCEDCDQLRGID